MYAKFETPFGELLSGEAWATVLDPHGHAPAHIIQTDHDWAVRVGFYLDGLMAPFVCGIAIVKVFAESIGPGPEKLVGSQVVSLDEADPLPLKRRYTTTVRVPAGELPPGPYKLATTITYENGGIPLEMAALVEGPMIQVYEGLPV